MPCGIRFHGYGLFLIHICWLLLAFFPSSSIASLRKRIASDKKDIAPLIDTQRFHATSLAPSAD